MNEQFNKNFINKNTDEIWQRSKTCHLDKNGEWKVGIVEQTEPSVIHKITIGSDGKVLRHDK